MLRAAAASQNWNPKKIGSLHPKPIHLPYLIAARRSGRSYRRRPQTPIHFVFHEKQQQQPSLSKRLQPYPGQTRDLFASDSQCVPNPLLLRNAQDSGRLRAPFSREFAQVSWQSRSYISSKRRRRVYASSRGPFGSSFASSSSVDFLSFSFSSSSSSSSSPTHSTNRALGAGASEIRNDAGEDADYRVLRTTPVNELLDQQAGLELSALTSELKEHDRLYYLEGSPSISDQEYDALAMRLKELESRLGYSLPDSRTNRIGYSDEPEPKQDSPRSSGSEDGERRSSPHLRQMMSLDNCFSEKELADFLTRVRKSLGVNATNNARSSEGDGVEEEGEEEKEGRKDEEKEIGPGLEFWAEPKIDGLSASLRYAEGRLTRVTTRGDGFQGEDVTSRALQVISNLPQSLGENSKTPLPALFEVRGEVYMPPEIFLRENAKREALGLGPFANPRNAAAGSLRQLVASSRSTATSSAEDVEGQATLRFCAYDAVLPLASLDASEGEMRGGEEVSSIALPPTQFELMKWLKDSLGFQVPEPAKITTGIEEMMGYFTRLELSRKELVYEADGGVFKLNDRALHKLAGHTSRSPRWAIAQKFTAATAESKVLDIKVQVGRSGKLTPVALLSPTLLNGVTVSRATLHNFVHVEALGVKPGDTVTIRRSGDVIPQVLSVAASSK